MRYQVPQFIEVEDRIIGPLTLKQFIYLAGGGAICFIAFRYFPTIIAFVVIPVVAALAAALAFYKVNNKPFIVVLEAAFKYGTGSRLYIWKKEPKEVTKEEKEEREYNSLYIPKLSGSKLQDLTWSLDVKNSSNPTTEENEKTTARY